MGEVSNKGRQLGRWIALLVVGMLAGSVMLTPVRAHITTFNHLKKKHFYTKKAADEKFYAKTAADAKFLDAGEGNTAFVNSNELETKVATSTTEFGVTSTTFVNVSNASTSVTVPTGQNALIIATFAAESFCDATDGTGYCTARILIGGTEADPAAGSDYVFDFNVIAEPHLDGLEGHSMTRSRGPLGPGTYTIQVQAATVDPNANTGFTLDDWHLTVQRVPA